MLFRSTMELAKEKEYFNTLADEMKTLFQPDELLGRAKVKMKGTLVDYLAKSGIPKSETVERRVDQNISFKCDVCGRNLQKSMLDVAVENSEQLERGIKVQKGFGSTTLEIYPIHECVTEMREIPIFLDSMLEYRRYGDSRPV